MSLPERPAPVVIVTDDGFRADDWTGGFAAPDDIMSAVAAAGAGARHLGLDLDASSDPAALGPLLDRIALVRVDFPAFADGRGFTIARRLRLMGYRGRLRARGQVIADQYAMARRAGFDEIEIDAALAGRQPEPQWLARADWRAHDYQARLRR